MPISSAVHSPTSHKPPVRSGQSAFGKQCLVEQDVGQLYAHSFVELALFQYFLKQ
jgi:hypothetical protein